MRIRQYTRFACLTCSGAGLVFEDVLTSVEEVRLAFPGWS